MPRKPRYSGDTRRITKTATILANRAHHESSGHGRLKALVQRAPGKTIIRSELCNAKSNFTL